MFQVSSFRCGVRCSTCDRSQILVGTALARRASTRAKICRPCPAAHRRINPHVGARLNFPEYKPKRSASPRRANPGTRLVGQVSTRPPRQPGGAMTSNRLVGARLNFPSRDPQRSASPIRANPGTRLVGQVSTCPPRQPGRASTHQSACWGEAELSKPRSSEVSLAHTCQPAAHPVKQVSSCPPRANPVAHRRINPHVGARLNFPEHKPKRSAHLHYPLQGDCTQRSAVQVS